ncbi:40S ribosomal protein S3-A [Larimichthys crocea]|uniref:Uncharacterized protein n=1 Tax=Larimichthys crocea TaxID=215358 RepID=A0ACD3QKG5_LARCR|nr:40S ribosomal protein S3-A [Larimichthys crocea]
MAVQISKKRKVRDFNVSPAQAAPRRGLIQMLPALREQHGSSASAGHELRTEPSRAGPSRAEPGRAGPGSSPLSRAEPSRAFVSDGIFKAELNEFLTRELAEDGYSGVEVRVTPTRTEIIILATRTQNVLGEKGRRIRELTAVVQKRFGFPEGSVEVFKRHQMKRDSDFCVQKQ